MLRARRLGLACLWAALALSLSACSSKGDTGDDPGDQGGDGPPTTTGEALGVPHEGVYHLGPVDFAETQYHNACAPANSRYRQELRASVGLGGEYLAGVSSELSQGGGICDACILIETAMGKSIVARLVTYGAEHAPGDIDVSPSVFEAIHLGEDPRSMSWSFTRCPDVGGIQYEFQTGANVYWSSLWLRNPRVPLTKLEVQSKNHPSFVELARAGDGTLTDASGFGDGPFTLRATAMDGQVLTEELPGFTPGSLVASQLQFE